MEVYFNFFFFFWWVIYRGIRAPRERKTKDGVCVSCGNGGPKGVKLIYKISTVSFVVVVEVFFFFYFCQLFIEVSTVATSNGLYGRLYYVGTKSS